MKKDLLKLLDLSREDIVTILNTLVTYIDSVVYQYPYVLALGESVFRIISSLVTAALYTVVVPVILKAVRKILK